MFYIEYDVTDRLSRRSSVSGDQGTAGGCQRGDRRHGRQRCAVLGSGSIDDLFLEPRRGWKEECGCASLAAAEAATDAALQMQQQLLGQGRVAFVKTNFEPAGQQRCGVALLPIRYSKQGSSTQWPVIYLPKGGSGAGLSGNWKGAAIDLRLYPNDTVLFEVLDAQPGSQAAADGRGSPAGAADGSGGEEPAAADDSREVTAATHTGGAATAAGEVNNAAAPAKRLHMLMHVFRAMRFEDTTQLQSLQVAVQPGAAASAACVSHADGADELSAAAADVSLEQLLPVTPSRDQEAAVTAALGSQETQGGGQVQIPNTTQHPASGATPGTSLEVAANGGADDDDDDEEEEEEEEDDEQLDVPLAAEAGLIRGVKIARLSGSPGVAPAAAEQASQPQACDVRKQHKPAAKSKQKVAAAVYSSGHAAVATAAVDQPRISHRVRIAKRRFTCDEAAVMGSKKRQSSCASAADPLQCKGVGSCKASSHSQLNGAQKSQQGGGHSRQAAAEAQAALVPKPANPTELVPPPTDAEAKKDAAGGPFFVRELRGHRVVKGGAAGGDDGDDEFLVHWWGFGCWWDSWESISNLDAAPGTYTWRGGRAAIPAQFRR
eukprot:gene11697-11841_t